MTDEGKNDAVLRASCLCGGIRFEIRGPVVGINQCHCDKCRKESGTGSSTFIPVHAEQFTWISGADLVGEYRGDGWAIERCKVCGSLAPDHNQTRALYNIPAGLLDDDTGVEVAVAGGKSVGVAVREIGVTDHTYYRWRREYGGLNLDQARRLKKLEQENARLKRTVADLALDKQILKEAAEGNF